MTGHEIRQKFLDYFAERGHRLVRSSPLLPANDPTLLFANAGMNQFKEVLLGLTQDELREFMIALGEKPFRARQLYDAIYRRRITSFDAMTDLPKTLRRILQDHAVVTHTRIENEFLSSDGTR